jgi:two-component system, chemotaxis family, protein-glutamate methylesterase/glutaminase
MANRDIVVVGASAGGVDALRTLAAGLPPDWPGSLFVVLHMAPEGPSVLSAILRSAGPLPAAVPHEPERVQAGRIYVAHPDHHLVIQDGSVMSVRGPRENRHRPAVDPLFRSAALSYGPRVVGVVLTGSLDDGTAGLLAVKAGGGLGIAQDPEDALFPSMPRNAIDAGGVDHVLPLAAIPRLLVKLAREAVPAAAEASAVLRKEVEIHLGGREDVGTMGKPSPFSCPECHGVLWEVDDPGIMRFRCRVGHAYSSESLVAEQDEAHEDALWAAMRSLEESAHLSERMAASFRDRNHHRLAHRMAERGQAARRHADQIRKLLAAQDTPILTETVDG